MQCLSWVPGTFTLVYLGLSSGLGMRVSVLVTGAHWIYTFSSWAKTHQREKLAARPMIKGTHCTGVWYGCGFGPFENGGPAGNDHWEHGKQRQFQRMHIQGDSKPRLFPRKTCLLASKGVCVILHVNGVPIHVSIPGKIPMSYSTTKGHVSPGKVPR